MIFKLKIRLMILVICGLLIIGGIGIFLWQQNQSKQLADNPTMNKSSQDMTIKSSKGSLDKPITASVDASSKLIQTALVSGEKKDQTKKDDILSNSLEKNLQTNTESRKETPAETFQRYLKVTESQEVKDEVYAVTLPMEDEIWQTYHQKIDDLEKKEKELEIASGDNGSKVQDELAKVKAELWETRVERSEKIMLMADAGHKVLLKYLTNEDIRIGREEMWRTMAPPGGFSAILGDAKAREMSAKLKTEAMARLKAKGWIPANPNESYY
jgi:uncharacterized protein YneF (UPF0154 family)